MTCAQSPEDVRDLRTIVVNVFIKYEEKETDLNATACQTSSDSVVVKVRVKNNPEPINSHAVVLHSKIRYLC